MTRPVSVIVGEIEKFKPSKGNWLGLDSLLQELFRSGFASDGIDAMLHVFERFPSEDGAGVFWGIVHGLESLPGYEGKLVASIRRVPSDFALMMVNRLLNADRKEVGSVQLLSLVEDICEDKSARREVRQEAQAILARHKT